MELVKAEFEQTELLEYKTLYVKGVKRKLNQTLLNFPNGDFRYQ